MNLNYQAKFSDGKNEFHKEISARSNLEAFYEAQKKGKPLAYEKGTSLSLSLSDYLGRTIDQVGLLRKVHANFSQRKFNKFVSKNFNGENFIINPKLLWRYNLLN